MKSISTFFFSAWCAICFGLQCILSFPVLFIGVYFGGKKAKEILHFTPTFISQNCFKWFPQKLNVTGHKIDPDKKYVFCCNHSSNLDPVLASGHVPSMAKYIAKAEILKLPIFGFVLKHFYVPVVREHKVDRKQRMQQTIDAVKDGASLIIFPEGTRNTTNAKLLPFKIGAFLIAIEAETDIIPITFCNARWVCPPNKWLIRPGHTIEVRIDEPISVKGLETDRDVESLRDKVQSIMDGNMTDFLNKHPEYKL